MIFKQLFDSNSSTYTYIISSGKGREALIIDPVIENTKEYLSLLSPGSSDISELLYNQVYIPYRMILQFAQDLKHREK